MTHPSQHFRYDFSSPNALVGHVIAERYLVERLVKRGHVASVFEARDVREHRPVAVKVLSIDALVRRSGQHVADIVELFEQASAHTRRLQSEYSVSLLDFGRTATFLFVVSEWLPGESLKELMAREQRIDPLRAMRFGSQLAAALEETHSMGWWHGDVRPSNIYIARDAQGGEVARLLDHGISRVVAAPLPVQLTANGRASGVPDYMSPEQCRGGSFDRRTDLYSLGIVLFEMLTGSVPYRGRSQLWVMQQHVATPAPRVSDVNARLGRFPLLVTILETCLAKSPDLRYVSSRRLKQALDSAIDEYLAVRG